MRSVGLGVAILAALLVGVVIGKASESAPAPLSTATIPPEVQETRAALLGAASNGDYEALRPLIPESGFEYTFGDPVEGGPIAYWQQLERTTDERPLATLATILEMPYVISRGMYAWPWAYTVTSADALSKHEREVLDPLGPAETLFPAESGYFGWRTGIEPDGSWSFFIAGD